MKNSTPPWRLALFGAIALMAMAAFAILYFFDPSTHAFYPVCLFHQLTGLDCPGCGAQRALHQLAHGNFSAAWRFNPLAILLVPAVLWLGLRELIFLITGRRLPGVVTRPAFGWTLAVAMVVFGIVRNLPPSTVSNLLAMSH